MEQAANLFPNVCLILTNECFSFSIVTKFFVVAEHNFAIISTSD